MDCSCKYSDSWKCANEKNLPTVACDCGCHSYLKEFPKPETGPGNLSTEAPASATITVKSGWMQISQEGGKSYLKFRIDNMDNFLAEYDGKDFAGAELVISMK